VAAREKSHNTEFAGTPRRPEREDRRSPTARATRACGARRRSDRPLATRALPSPSID